MHEVRGKKVFVGLSGGVDSAVTAALLQRAGAEVTGVFIKGWYPPRMHCTWADDRRDAMRVAAFLGIPFHTLDAAQEYKQGVINYLLAEYAAGRTPNPDIMCNREVKFGAFYTFARATGADFIATGHYAQTERARDEVRLLRGIDDSKDQSYFLWAVPKDALQHTLLPVGGMEKTETRALAKKFGLPVAEKKDSQGICFLGSVSVEDFLAEELQVTPGRAVDAQGALVGGHRGAALYTLGERVALTDAAPGPWFVIKKDMYTNTLTVAHVYEEAGSNDQRALRLRATNWLSAIDDAEYEAQYRYHGPRILGTWSTATNTFTPTQPLKEPIAAGQSLVLYSGMQCMGGGIIE